jgi:sec-independent protein translocase protein TatA
MPIGVPEMLVILVIALVVLGPKKLPEAGKSLGKGMREFKDSLAGDSSHDDEPAAVPVVTTAAAPVPPVPAPAPAPVPTPEHV